MLQRIKNVGEVISQLKPLLKTYLEEMGTEFKPPLFTCPNREAHNNEDAKPSAGFVPDTNDTIFNCFACGASGDIFTAVHYLEGKAIQGADFYKVVKYLADKYSIKYELEPLSEKEKELDIVQKFLVNLVLSAHNYLIKEKPKTVLEYLKQRKWETLINPFDLGYLPKSKKVESFFQQAFSRYPFIQKHFPISYEQLAGKLVYPIRHKYGIYLGIVSRVVSSNDDRPKYSKHFLSDFKPEGILFNLTKNYKTIYLVEGASSVFTLYAHGIPNSVAMLGCKFTSLMYNKLIKNQIQKVIFCFDGDQPGETGLEKALQLVQTKPDIDIYIKKLPKGLDPDDLVIKEGIRAFKNLPEISHFDYKLKQFLLHEKQEDKESLFFLISAQQDAIKRDKIIKKFIQETGITKTVLTEELKKFEIKQHIVSDVGVADLLKEQEALLKDIELFELKSWQTNKLIGIPTGFPILDENIDGLQSGLILVSGKWNVGKSAFLITTATNMLKDPNNYVLYFSIDDPVIVKTLPRFVANLGFIPINTVMKPIYGIEKNELLEEAEKQALRKKREEAIQLLKQFSGRLGLKDSSYGYDISFVEKTIKIYKLLAQDKNLIVFVDFLNMVKHPKALDRTELETQLAEFFKHVAGLYNVPVVCTVESNKTTTNREMKDFQIKGSSALPYRADLILLLHSDFELEEDSDMFFYDDEGKAQPIVKMTIAKSKFSGFRKSLYYKFYRDVSKFVECTEEEMKNYGKKF